jgi:hypothetical protein
MRLDLERVQANVRSATTEDLLDRITIYRAEMEPEAVVLIERELRERGISEEDQRVHGERRQGVLTDAQGQPVRCGQCTRPAVVRGWSWHRLWGLVPVFPRWQAFCEEHRPKAGA